MRIIISKSVRVVPLNFSKKNFRGRVFAELGFAMSLRPTAWGSKIWVCRFKTTPPDWKSMLIPHYEMRFHYAEAPMWCIMVRCNMATHQCGAWWCGAIPMHQCGAWWCGAVCQCTNVVHDVAVQHGNMRVRGSGWVFKLSVVFLRHNATLRTKKHSTNMTIQ